jgi:NHLM bacteriocin system ABC transporter ATP-binding protein
MIVRTGPVPSAYRLRIVEARSADLVGLIYQGKAACVIGRADDCDFVVPDSQISRRHATLEPVPGGFLLRDLGSANGTWIGDRRVQESYVDHFDRFRVGTAVFEVLNTDDLTGDALGLVRTMAVPVKEILEGIRVALAQPSTGGRLEDEGTEVVVAGNSPFLLDDPAVAWIVETGRVDLFAVAVKDRAPVGSRSHFVSVEASHAFFGMDSEALGIGSGFLASGKPGSRLRKISVARLEELASAGQHAGRIASLLEAWTSSLTRALVRDVPLGQSAHIELEEGGAAEVGFQKRARCRKGSGWIELEGGEGLFISLAEIGTAKGRILFPLTNDGWIESTRDGLLLTSVPAAEAVARPEAWQGLQVFHRALCECEFINKRLATVDEFNRLRSKTERAESAREEALREIGGVLAGQGGAPGLDADTADADPVFLACRAVCRDLGIEAKRPPESKAELDFEERLEGVALASRFKIRKIALKGRWWREEHGPILGRIEATNEPVALLQASSGSYDQIDPRSGSRTRVTAEVVEALDPFGWVVYRRFKDGVLTAKDIVLFGVRGVKGDLLSLLAMGIAIGLVGSMTPYFTGQMFDRAILRAEDSLLLQYSCALLAFAIAGAAFKVTESIATLRLQGKMDYSVQAALWDRLLDLPSAFFRKYSAGDLADRAGGIDAIWQLLAGAGIGAILGALSSVFYVGMMLVISVPLTLVGLLLTAVYVGVTTGANFLQLRVQREQLAIRGKLAGLVLQLIEGVGKLRVSGSEHHGFRVWARDFAEQRRISFRIGGIQNFVSVFGSGYSIFASMAIFSVLAGSQGAAAAGGKGALTTGSFITFAASFGAFLGAVQSLAEASLSLLAVVPIWERLMPILETSPEVDDAKAAPSRLRGAIELSHLWFRYTEDGPYVLRDLSLSVQPGEFVAFVGPSGCGKSTLLRLMLGFEKPEKGSIYYDGQDLAALDVRLVRKQLGVVLQDSSLLPADIYRNIVGTSSRTIDEAWEAAESCGFADDIHERPMGMHPFVAAGGGGLSGGQRQRLMIARAVVDKPRILFLDEATSALDNRTQGIVTESMNRMRATRICIAHRLSTIIKADRIHYVEGGVVRESGTFDELMRRRGLFHEMASRQLA